jgi:hypothetical protein
MRRAGQVLVIVAFLIPVVLLLLAMAVDTGRIYVQRSRDRRAAQAAADAGISYVAERMTTQVIIRQTQAANTSLSTPTLLLTARIDGAISITPTAVPVVLQGWLTDADRATLISPEVAGTAAAVALEFAGWNGLSPDGGDPVEVGVIYPQASYAPADESLPTLQLLVYVRREIRHVLSGLIGPNHLELWVEALAEINQR